MCKTSTSELEKSSWVQVLKCELTSTNTLCGWDASHIIQKIYNQVMGICDIYTFQPSIDTIVLYQPNCDTIDEVCTSYMHQAQPTSYHQTALIHLNTIPYSKLTCPVDTSANDYQQTNPRKFTRFILTSHFNGNQSKPATIGSHKLKSHKHWSCTTEHHTCIVVVLSDAHQHSALVVRVYAQAQSTQCAITNRTSTQCAITNRTSTQCAITSQKKLLQVKKG